ncbi:RasGEF [Nowakowskiella sp. JEL0078]|nr:RasGEF [Nowakowskiella sp. JEL0078]
MNIVGEIAVSTTPSKSLSLSLENLKRPEDVDFKKSSEFISENTLTNLNLKYVNNELGNNLQTKITSSMNNAHFYQETYQTDNPSSAPPLNSYQNPFEVESLQKTDFLSSAIENRSRQSSLRFESQASDSRSRQSSVRMENIHLLSVNLSASDFLESITDDENDGDNISITSSGVSSSLDTIKYENRKKHHSESSLIYSGCGSINTINFIQKNARPRVGPIILANEIQKEEICNSVGLELIEALNITSLVELNKKDRIATTESKEENLAIQGKTHGLVWGNVEPLATTEIIEGRKKVKFATLMRLIKLLTSSEDIVDQEYLSDFLKTYRYFVDASDVARILIFSYLQLASFINKTNSLVTATKDKDANKSKNLFFGKKEEKASAPWESPEDQQAKIAEWQIAQLRTLNVFKKWIEYQSQDFYTNAELFDITSLFLETFVKKDSKRVLYAESLLKNLESKGNPISVIIPTPNLPATNKPEISINTSISPSSIASTIYTSSPTSPERKSPLPINTHTRTESNSSWGSALSETVFTTLRRTPIRAPSTTNNTPEYSKWSQLIAETEPELLAMQFTILEQQMFQKVEAYEFYCQNWNDRLMKDVLSPNLVAVIQWFNKVSYGMATEVVKEHRFQQRVGMLKRLIFVAQICAKFNNFNLVFEIVSGLNLNSVIRLKKTWKALPKKYVDVWNSLNFLIMSEGSYRNYRTRLKELTDKEKERVPILPYLGVTLKDLTFAEDGNPTIVQGDPSNSINFLKFRMIADMIESVVRCQKPSYTFQVDNKISNWLKYDWVVFDDAELYAHSKVCEPRGPTPGQALSAI